MRETTLAQVLGFGAVLLMAGGGCSDEDPDTSMDAAEIKDLGVTGEPTPAVPDAGVDAPVKPAPLACSNTVTAPTVTLTHVSFMKLQPATGGTILDGHYVLTSGSTSSSSALPRASELWIRDGRYEYHKKTGPTFSYGGTLTPVGTVFKTTVDCGNQGSMPPFQYSVKGSQLSLQFTNINGIKYLYRFERQ